MTPCQNCSSSELEFGMRPQAIWMFYNHSVLKFLNLSFLRLIVKRTKTKVDFRFRMKFIRLKLQSRESWRPTEVRFCSLKTRDWRRRRQEKIRKRSKREKMKKWMTVSNYWIIVDIVEIVFYYLLIDPTLYRL